MWWRKEEWRLVLGVCEDLWECIGHSSAETKLIDKLSTENQYTWNKVDTYYNENF